MNNLKKVLWIDNGDLPMTKQVEKKLCSLLQATSIIVVDCKLEELEAYICVDNSFDYFITTINEWTAMHSIKKTINNDDRLFIINALIVREDDCDWVIQPPCGTHYLSFKGLLQPVVNSNGIITDTVEVTDITN